MFKEHAEYCQQLLIAQYKISEIISHKLTRGEMREDFLIEILKNKFSPAPCFYKGMLTDNSIQSNQIDILLSQHNVEVSKLGTQIFIHPKDCLMVIEVKSNATGRDLKKFNKNIKKIHRMNSDTYPLCGMFCYNVNLTKKTILKRFGFDYDKETDTFFQSGRLPLYNELDFFISIQKEKEIYLRKDTDQDKFIVASNYPVILELFSLIGSLIKQV